MADSMHKMLATSNSDHNNNGKNKFSGGAAVYVAVLLYTSESIKIPSFKTLRLGASLVAQWLGVRLPMQGTRVRALVWEDPTCHGATGPVSHNY